MIKVLSPLEGYNLWARTYHTEDNPIKTMSDDFILSEIKEGRLLDAGCGTGKLLQKGKQFTKGIDLSPAMIEEARKNCPNATLVCADLSRAIIEENFYDVVICGLVLGHIENVEPVLVKLANALKMGGKIILTDFHPYQSMMKAKRTFKYESKVFEVKHSIHKLDEYFMILKRAGVEIRTFKEPLFQGKPVIFGIAGVKC
ncbi:MAG TPA: class I SAM-dependent methyltransferase [Cyclobacteriaceae bacterium]|nr:class I SAM-dependent methyltransferase [Cyclobacteriaceae bacterium]